ncbi:MAG: 3'-phosphoesterase [Odoribacter sp.]|nr:3'-phosphoesterase [Odoribacter sp.]
MALEKYKEKRDFNRTPEPEPIKGEEDNKLIFVVQRHEASHLHFDFRLEWDGVLKSWAVPKGPSMDTSDKRLAVMVEDHPIDYAQFAGEIPEGNYGAGTVEIWDSGTWMPVEGCENVDKALEDGLLEFNLYGEKLKGKFALIELKKGTAKNGWLLVKKKDEFAIHEKYDANYVDYE